MPIANNIQFIREENNKPAHVSLEGQTVIRAGSNTNGKTKPLMVKNLQRAVMAAQNYRRLRRLGATVRKSSDAAIATFCIAERHALLHNDRDFDPFEKHLGLRVLH